MRAKTDEELYLLLRVHSQDYTLEELRIASEEFRRRHLDVQSMSRIMESADAALKPAEKAPDERDGNMVGQEQNPMSDGKETGAGCGCIFFLMIIGAAVFAGYEGLDSIGWISHREETTITARGDWLVDESKECWSSPVNNEEARLLKKGVGYAMYSISCDDGPEHEMKVTFYGRKVQSEYKVVNWRCTRSEVSFFNDNSFTCYQTGGQR